MATAGFEGIMKDSLMVYPIKLEDLTFKEISETMQRNMQTKTWLVIAERVKYVHLTKRWWIYYKVCTLSQHCEFEILGQENSLLKTVWFNWDGLKEDTKLHIATKCWSKCN